MKRILSLLLVVLFVFGFAACGADNAASEGEVEVGATSDVEDVAGNEGETTAKDGEDTAAGQDTLVVYFSATGTTKAVAEKIAAVTEADLYEITAAEPYSEADLDWNDENSRTTKEQNDKTARPAIGGAPVAMDGYTTVYIGFPIWWGEEPRIMDTFVESYDFDGVTLIPFCTSGGSGIGRSGENLAENAGGGTWLEGERWNSDVSEAELKEWIDGLR